jgi:hypothetical protein
MPIYNDKTCGKTTSLKISKKCKIHDSDLKSFIISLYCMSMCVCHNKNLIVKNELNKQETKVIFSHFEVV